MSSRHLIFYHGTEDEVRLGDRILVRRWLRSDLLATVTYIPGESPPDPNILDHQWAYETGDGFVYVMDYEFLRGQLWLAKCIQLVCRAGAEAEAATKSLEMPDGKPPPETG